MKRMTFAEMEALRAERREARKDRPKSTYKGLSWSVTKSMWYVQVWDKVESKVLTSFPCLSLTQRCSCLLPACGADLAAPKMGHLASAYLCNLYDAMHITLGPGSTPAWSGTSPTGFTCWTIWRRIKVVTDCRRGMWDTTRTKRKVPVPTTKPSST